MAEIKDLGIFSKNKGLDAIKKAKEKERKAKNDAEQTKTQEKISDSSAKESTKTPPKSITKKVKTIQSKNRSRNPKGAGAPIRNFDRVYSASQPVKLSALLNGTTRALTEKYMTSDTKDEILRKALNDYVKHNLTKEDKQDLLNDVIKELDMFRQKFPTVEELDHNGEVISTVEEIETKTIEELKKSWGLSN